ncbi:MlaD family protein [Fulvivirga ulvae]|uniref:MlaD family protein n=1 Tax=Fulvivirga ulvae TaxID=2904245 RepID=UPI001F1CBF02|nr:MlaD family protein [Fulvivirga ulvae]UII31395.1 MlaD family protein [Fulvivirga ulvae]
MSSKIKKDITLGIFIVLGLVLFIGLIYYIGSQQQLFGSKVKVTALFKNVGGLQSGNNVRFSGIKVGTVKGIEIATDSTARVTLLINENASRFIKQDAFATIDSDGLMGNKIVSISAGSAQAPVLKDGDVLKTKEPVSIDDVIASFKRTSDNARELTGNLNEISRQIKNAEGLLGKVVSDSVLAGRVSHIVGSIEKTSVNAAQITDQIELAAMRLNSGDGLLARAIHDEELGKSVETTLDSVRYAGKNLADASRDLKRFMHRLNDNEGLLDKLLNDSITARNLQETMYNVKTGTEDLDEVMNTLNNSWLLNLFSRNKKEGKDKTER